MSDRKYYDEDGNERSLYWMVRNRPEWAQARFTVMYNRIEQLESDYQDLLNRSADLLVPKCEQHTGDNTPPPDVWFEEYAGRCVVCDAERIEQLEAREQAIRGWADKWGPTDMCQEALTELEALLEDDA
jgi:hypothetical protein